MFVNWSCSTRGGRICGAGKQLDDTPKLMLLGRLSRMKQRKPGNSLSYEHARCGFQDEWDGLKICTTPEKVNVQKEEENEMHRQRTDDREIEPCPPLPFPVPSPACDQEGQLGGKNVQTYVRACICVVRRMVVMSWRGK